VAKDVYLPMTQPSNRSCIYWPASLQHKQASLGQELYPYPAYLQIAERKKVPEKINKFK